MLYSLRVTPENANVQNVHAQASPGIIQLPAALIPAQKQSVPDFPESLPCIDLRFCSALALWAVIYRCTSGAPSSLQPCVRGNMQGWGSEPAAEKLLLRAYPQYRIESLNWHGDIY